MKKLFLLFSVVFIFILSFSTGAFAAAQQDISVSILSPKSAEGYPGMEQKIIAEVKNNTGKPIEDVMVYITMADINKHMTVNLEDYSADKPIVIGTLVANEAKTVELPVRLVYVSRFYLYTTVVSGTSTQIVSSDAIPVQIIGNTMINKTIVQIVSAVTPLTVLIGVVVIMFEKRKSCNDN
ncbi:MAG: hypothetical protein WCN92_13255 [Eubacteriales bacterium]